MDGALDMKLREMEHTCTRECVLSEPEQHFEPWHGLVGDASFRIGERIVVTFADRLRFFIQQIREAGW